MSVQLEEYAEELGSLSEHSRDILQASWQEATRVFSRQGLDIYLGGALSLKNLGRGHELVSTFIQNAPGIARTLGEGVIDSLIENAMMMASKTSGTVIELVLATAPTAADRLADAELFKKYLQLLNNLVATAPRGIRPMLENLDTLFAHLTLGGLRRWSNWGAQVHRTNYEEQIRYFSLASKESQAMLQQERKGTLFVDVQRRINMYLRALWARDFFMRPTSGDFEKREGYRPYIEDYLLHLPDAYDDIVIEGQEPISGLTLYRAAAAHSAAHVVYTQEPISAENLNNLQMAVISVFEDARIEALAIQDFPGLRPIWAQFHTIPATQANTMGDYLNRMARALLDPNFEDDHPLIARARELFAAEQHRLRDNQLSWDCGAVLAHELMSLRIPFQQRTDVLTAPYRDDNRYFWAFEEFDFDKSLEAGYDNVQSVRKQVSVMEMINEIDSELTDGNPQEVWVLGTELFPYEDHGVSWNEMEGNPPVSAPFHYPEWDYQIQHERPSWATVLEKRAKLGELSLIDDIAARYKREISRMKFLLDAMQPQGVQRIRKLEDGDEVDINAA
ncbi:MAG: VWA domain-containing protein, partial [Halothiobacillus sp. 39-53-45]